MIDHTLDREHRVLTVRPHGPLDAADFADLAATADPFIAEVGGLNGLVIEAPQFPGWDSLGAMAAHFRFVRNHHRQIRRIALVTDSPLGNVAEHLARHFVSAEIRHFPATETEAARTWITS